LEYGLLMGVVDVGWLVADECRMSRAWQNANGIYKRNDRTNGRKVSGLIHVIGRLDEVDGAGAEKGFVLVDEANCLSGEGWGFGLGSSQMRNPSATQRRTRESREEAEHDLQASTMQRRTKSAMPSTSRW
jgi:hypothetical protein